MALDTLEIAFAVVTLFSAAITVFALGLAIRAVCRHAPADALGAAGLACFGGTVVLLQAVYHAWGAALVIAAFGGGIMFAIAAGVVAVIDAKKRRRHPAAEEESKKVSKPSFKKGRLQP